MDISADKKAAYQARLYSYNERLPITILTNFKQFAVYDYRITQSRPDPDDQPEKGRREFFSFEKYLDNLEFLYSTFSYQAAKQLNFDLYVEENPSKLKIGVDEDFLNTIEAWRKILALDVARNNLRLSNHELNYAVQATIDRIIFLRMAEDRGIENEAQLQSLINGANVYKRLFQLFQRCDDKYNSGLFNFKTDQVSPNLKIQDKTLTEIIDSLYGDDCPYIFSSWDADILGSVYERFLGKVIHLTATHQARVEEKPEVKKAKGVYYTPKYIVDYIVKNTVGKIIENKSPAQISNLKILDPACGSGSFLIAAYSYLLDYHLQYYLRSADTHVRGQRIYQGPRGQWLLTTQEKKRILLNNIFGVDIDPQAVEVTKLSLLLKVLENEDQESLSFQQKLFYKERALPDLDNNIKCGNSLIGPDFYQNQQGSLFDDEQKYKINAFDWQTEFPEVFKNGGFDVVIGNPPYIDSELMSKEQPYSRVYCSRNYKAASGNWDIFCVFIEKAIMLCKAKGLSSMIVPNKLGSADYASWARSVLTLENQLISIRDYSRVPVFPVSVYPIIYLVQKRKALQNSSVNYERMEMGKANKLILSESKCLEYDKYFKEPRYPWNIFSDNFIQDKLFERMKTRFPSLGAVAKVLGAATVSEAYEIKPLIQELRKESKTYLKIINSGTIDRYRILWGEKAIRYLGFSTLRPVVSDSDIDKLPYKRKEQSKTPKIIVAGMTKSLECVLDPEGLYLAGKSTSIILSKNDLLYILALLNSKLINRYFLAVFGGNRLQGGYLRIGPPQLRAIPIRTINLSSKSDTSKHENVVALVQKMIDLNNKFKFAKTPDEKTRLEREIKATDEQIDQLVYELYNLTEDEIKVIEESVQR